MNTADRNSTQAISAVIYAAVAGPCSFILQPGLVHGMVTVRGYTEEQAGIVASVENAGLALGTILASVMISRVRWTTAVKFMAVLAGLTSFLGILTTDYAAFSAVRFLSAINSGGLIALTFSMMSLTTKDQRNFSYLIGAVLTYGALGLLILPSALAAIGFNGVLAFFGLFYLSILALTSYYAPFQSHAAEQGKAAYKFSPALRYTTLAAMLLYNTAIGMVWVYLFVVGIDAAMPEQEVANALTTSQFLGIAGALLAAGIHYRFGRNIPLFIGVWGGACGIFVLTGVIDTTTYWLGVCVFNLLWNLTVPYMLAILARFDDSGRFVSQGVAIQFIGYAVGPYLASQLFNAQAAQPFDIINLIAVGLFVASALLLLPVNMTPDSDAPARTGSQS